MILDEPIEKEVVPDRKKISWFELIMVTVLLAVAIVRELTSNIMLYAALGFAATVLAGGYLFGYYWMNKPSEKNFRTVVITVLYGLSFAMATLSFAALEMFAESSMEASAFALLVFILVLVIDFITSIKRSRVINEQTVFRAVALGTIVLILNLIPQSVHVPFTYRKYPQFVAYYKKHQTEGSFLAIFYTFQRENKLVDELK